ncbi:nose resistant to fluoxetine protein 6-like [Dermacentor andersoni]|uniref:nose resistant to fluoxetine protein 6-like n=1 Tax=Dermacentor andersoni TaxID=34620 RepID=UPI002155B59D|nr:nose resistant to fluoxetine protein 6-like [Dermacentor andersoni]
MKVPRVLVLCAAVCSVAVPCARAVTENSSPGLIDKAKAFIGNMLNSKDSALTRRLLEADISPSCTVGLLKLMRGIRNLDPWVIRMFDASGKYPTGLFQGTLADLGAFDECVETLVHDEFGNEKVRGQYCNMYVPMTNDTRPVDYLASALRMSHPRTVEFAIGSSHASMVEGARLGICFINDCNEEDTETVINAILGGLVDVKVRDCITNEPKPWTITQISIVAFLGTLAIVIAASSTFDYYLTNQQIKKGPLQRALCAFSLEANIQLLLNIENSKESEASSYRFLHGIRILAIFSIVFGHSYSFFDHLALARTINILRFADTLGFSFVITGYWSVDVFFFLSGFLMVYNIDKLSRTNINRFYIWLAAIIRRHLRTTTPVFFVIMCCHLGPVVASGPNLKPLMEKIYDEFSREWWRILLQVRNAGDRTRQEFLGLLWFISADFQLFMVGMPLVLILKRYYWGKITAFGIVGAVCSVIAAWQLHGTKYPPFMMPIISDISIANSYYYDVYVWPFHHGMCYFAGCMVCLLVQRYRHVKISKLKQFSMWCLCATCGLTCLFIKYDWCRGRNPTEEWVTLLVSIANGLCCAVFLAWLVFACAAGRGGLVSRFLSWKALVPLSRLSFGIYCIHVPLYYFIFALARERTFVGNFTMVLLSLGAFVLSGMLSFIVFVACEAPVGRLEKMVLMPSSPQQKDLKERKAAPAKGAAQNGAPSEMVSTWIGDDQKRLEEVVAIVNSRL